MTSAHIPIGPSAAIKNVLYLTDFSASSEAALPFAVAMARHNAGSVEVLHVLTPVIPESCHDAVKADEALAEAEMKKIRPRIVGVPCQTTMAEGVGLWDAIERAILQHHIDLIVLGTHGRTGVPKLLLGSAAEEVFRRSPVPVLTVGPGVRNAAGNTPRFDRVLFATDFGSESEAAAPHALALAHEKDAQLILIHVMRKKEGLNPAEFRTFDASVAQAINELYQIVPGDTPLGNPAEVAIEYGDPADRIVEAAKERKADLIVLGVRNAAGHLGEATHLERATAHRVVIHAPCPVLTVPASEAAASAGERTRK